jgi:hypothetical protein
MVVYVIEGVITPSQADFDALNEAAGFPNPHNHGKASLGKLPSSSSLRYQSSVAVTSLKRQAEHFYRFELASRRPLGPHIFIRQRR